MPQAMQVAALASHLSSCSVSTQMPFAHTHVTKLWEVICESLDPSTDRKLYGFILLLSFF